MLCVMFFTYPADVGLAALNSGSMPSSEVEEVLEEEDNWSLSRFDSV